MADVTYKELERMTGDGKLHLFQWPPVPGLYYQITPSGHKSWVVRGQLKGKAILRTLGPFAGYKLSLAEEDGRKIKAMIDDGQDPAKKPEPVAPPVLLKEIWVEYERVTRTRHSASYHLCQKRDWKKFLEPIWGDLPAKSIDSGMVNRMLDLQTKSVCNKLIDQIACMWAVGQLYFPADNLVSPVIGRKRHTLKPRERFITAEEAPKLGKAWMECTHHDKYMLLWLLLTGSRDGIVLHWQPRWQTAVDRLEFPEGEPLVKKARFVVIPSLAQPLVKRFIPTTINRLVRLCYRLAEAAGIPKFSPHDLRRSFATFGVDINETDDQINSLLNHTRGKVTESYLKRNVPPLIPCAERISSHIVKLLGVDPSKF
jgi:integrase